jgi:hypothetical protein
MFGAFWTRWIESGGCQAIRGIASANTTPLTRSISPPWFHSTLRLRRTFSHVTRTANAHPPTARRTSSAGSVWPGTVSRPRFPFAILHFSSAVTSRPRDPSKVRYSSIPLTVPLNSSFSCQRNPNSRRICHPAFPTVAPVVSDTTAISQEGSPRCKRRIGSCVHHIQSTGLHPLRT